MFITRVQAWAMMQCCLIAEVRRLAAGMSEGRVIRMSIVARHCCRMCNSLQGRQNS